MAAAPLEPPQQWWRRPLTAADFLALDETEYQAELAEGRMLMIPPPMPRHGWASHRLAVAVNGAIPIGYRAIPEVGVNLELAPFDQPATIRIPDLVVAQTEAFRRVDREGGVLRASDVLLVVEIVSPGSVRTDRVIKRDEYADADIPHYWIVDLDPPESILAYHRAGEFNYADSGEITGIFTTTEPFPFELDLSTLV